MKAKLKIFMALLNSFIRCKLGNRYSDVWLYTVAGWGEELTLQNEQTLLEYHDYYELGGELYFRELGMWSAKGKVLAHIGGRLLPAKIESGRVLEK